MPISPLSSLAFLLGMALATAAHSAEDQPKPLLLWPEGAPDAKGDDPNLDVPTITLFRPAAVKANGASVVICPGGGYSGLATDHEGNQVAQWLNEVGITAAVLKYRLAPRYRHPAMLQDAGRAIRTLRAGAKEWNLDPKRVAILGFSAGGHLASTAGTHFDAGKTDASDPIERQSSRPDRMILLYPVIALNTPYAHGGSRTNLLGDNPPADLLASLSNETQVRADTPPTFLAHTDEDMAVPAENSLLFALALRKAKVPLELHIFEKGAHGLGLGGGRKGLVKSPVVPFNAWPKLCEAWLKEQGFLSKPD